MSDAPQSECGSGDDILTGRCACGAVSFSARGPFRPFVACHCDSCRRQTGHFVVATRAGTDGFRIDGEEHLKGWKATDEAVRRFCETCGSLMFWQKPGDSLVSIMAGCVDKPTNLPLGWHIYGGEKGDYYEIDDDLPVYPERSGI